MFLGSSYLQDPIMRMPQLLDFLQRLRVAYRVILVCLICSVDGVSRYLICTKRGTVRTYLVHSKKEYWCLDNARCSLSTRNKTLQGYSRYTSLRHKTFLLVFVPTNTSLSSLVWDLLILSHLTLLPLQP